MAARTIFSGSRRKLVLAFDIGTTYSGISYSILDPGQVPVVKGVTRFPAHETISGASKIPTIIWYDKGGNVRAVGAEAQKEGIYELALEEEWVKAEWFKLHLRSMYGAGANIAQNIPPLPLNKTVVQVFSDFLTYMLKCAKSYIMDTHANGAQLWSSVETDIDYVLSHPNGWEGNEQSQMRRAAVLAGLVPDTTAGHARISFVTEGEASLHFAIQNGVLTDALKKGEGVVIVDAGGGTIDISSYRRNLTGGDKTSFEEISAAQCHFHGSVFVSIHARLFLERLLRESKFLDDLDHVVRCFDKTTKPRFRSDEEPQYIKFASTRDNDPECGIRFGQLKLSGSDVALFFQPSITCVVNAVLDTNKTSHHKISHVVLVGGFAASDWLFNKVHDGLTPHGLNIMRPENHVNKAVSDGATSFYLDHYVRTRISKMVYGMFCNLTFDTSNAEHKQREHKATYAVSGDKLVPDAFYIILPKNTQVMETKEFRRSFFREALNMNDFKASSSIIQCYRGENAEPKWKDVDTANYTQLCTILTDLSHLPVRPTTSGTGVTFYRVDYDVCLLFGLTELKAQVVWKENGVEKRGPAKVVYDPDTSRDDPLN